MPPKKAAAAVAPPPPAEEKVWDWKDVHGLTARDDFDLLVAEHVALGQGIKEAKARQAEITGTLLPLIDSAGIKTVLVGFDDGADGKARVTRVADSTSSKLSEKLLIKNGVTAKQIADSKEETTRRGFLKITGPGEKEGGAE